MTCHTVGSVRSCREDEKISGPQMPSSKRAPCPPRRPPSTPPLPTRTLHLVPRQPETVVVLRSCGKVKKSGVRDSWPSAQTNTEVQTRRCPQSRSHLTRSGLLPSSQPALNALLPADPQPHCLIPLATPRRWGSENSVMSPLMFPHSISSKNLDAIDSKIEQAMDLVKSHLMMAVREEVELLRGYIRELHEKNKELERENQLLKKLVHTTDCQNTHKHLSST